MPNIRFMLPPFNRQLQENYLIDVLIEDQITGEQVLYYFTPLRWFLKHMDRIFFVESLYEAYAETSSDPEAACPVCLQSYQEPGEKMANSQTEQSSQQHNEKPLKLKCGHVIGIACLRRLADRKYLGTPTCPLCRRQMMSKIIEVIPLARSDGRPDLLGNLSLAARLYMMFSPTKPETFEGLYEWVHSPAFQGQTANDRRYFDVMRIVVREWEKLEDERRWQLMMARRRGELPDGGVGSEFGAEDELKTMALFNNRKFFQLFKALLSTSTPVLQGEYMVGI